MYLIKICPIIKTLCKGNAGSQQMALFSIGWSRKLPIKSDAISRPTAMPIHTNAVYQIWMLVFWPIILIQIIKDRSFSKRYYMTLCIKGLSGKLSFLFLPFLYNLRVQTSMGLSFHLCSSSLEISNLWLLEDKDMAALIISTTQP